MANNPPGLNAITYRVGTWATFNESLLARLSSSDYPALSSLRTRSDDDFTIAFLDATSVVLDILTFYQERLANESYLRTAQQLRSLTELSRLIGYEPAPGVAAGVWLAFTLTSTPGQPPDPSNPVITIPEGTQVQSVPVQGQKPQVFETSANIQAKSDWNALPVLTAAAWAPQATDESVYLAGITTQLQPGDVFLVVGDQRLQSSTSDGPWAIGTVTSAVADKQNNRTLVTWSQPLGIALSAPPGDHPTFHAFRQRAALFGYNALDPALVDQTNLTIPGLSNGDWNFQPPDSNNPNWIDLDSTYSKIIPLGWVVLSNPTAFRVVIEEVKKKGHPITAFESFSQCLYNVSSVSTITRSDYGLSAKISRVTGDTSYGLPEFYGATRSVSALAQSEMLPAAPQPLTCPLYGKLLDLATLRPDLLNPQAVAISGNRQKLAVLSAGLTFTPDDTADFSSAALNVGDVVTLIPPPANASPQPDWTLPAQILTLYVEDVNGRTGTIAKVALNQFALAPSASTDPVVSECALIFTIAPVSTPYPHTQIQLQSALTYFYDRATTTVNANVVQATNGQSVSEIVGSGSASTPDQEFTLKQSPLTYVQSTNSAGRQSTLQVQVNSVAWTEVPSLYGQNSSVQEFATLNQSDGTTDVLFGDGVEGALLPTGQNNIQANYRIGSGSAGNVVSGALTTLLDRPLGVSGVTNPEAANGGQDAQSIDDIRANAPQSVLTLGRAVSITDYQNFAGTYPGIAKAYAIWIPCGVNRGVFLTVAGVGGAALAQDSYTVTNLAGSLQNSGNPLIPITIQSYQPATFGLTASLETAANDDPTVVQNQVRAALLAAFSFDARSFGQAVSVDEIAAVIQAVPGIVAVNVTSLFLTTAPGQSFNRICASLPVASLQSSPQPAELLVLDCNPNSVTLNAMS